MKKGTSLGVQIKVGFLFYVITSATVATGMLKILELSVNKGV